MGTTLVAIQYQNGVIIGADTRTSISGYVSNRYASKITFVLESSESFDDLKKKQRTTSSTCCIARSGSAADTQRLADTIRFDVIRQSLEYGNVHHGTVSSVAYFLRYLLVKERSSNGGETTRASLIIAGYDHLLNRGAIYAVSPDGSLMDCSMKQGFAVSGSGSSYILGWMDSNFGSDDDGIRCEEMNEREGLDFVIKALKLAMDRDGSSGGFIRVYVIDRWGKRSMMVGGGEGRGSSSAKSKEKSSPSVHLENFAPRKN